MSSPTNSSTSSATTPCCRRWPSSSPLPWALVRGTPAGAETVHRLVGRGREFSADRRAALIVRYPSGHRFGAGVHGRRTGRRPPAWPPAPGRVAALTRWLWVDPMAGVAGRVAGGEPRRHPGPGRRARPRLTGHHRARPATVRSVPGQPEAASSASLHPAAAFCSWT